MTIPISVKFPESMDNDDNLFLVHDSLRLRLSEDYSPGDKVIYVEGEYSVMSKFPATGIITLTEQCSDIDKRALSFYYSSPPRTAPYSFGGLEILPEFLSLDSSKLKKITNVTMNVVDLHHNNLKNALIEVESFLGTRYDPGEETITGRINRLKEVALPPKAWFTANVLYGLAPLTVKFKNESLRLGDGYVKQTWRFKEEMNSGSSSSSMEEVLVIETDTKEEYLVESEVSKTFLSPGPYTVSLTVENQYGFSDSVEFESMIVARTECPEEAQIKINHRSSQNYTEGNLSLGTRPKVRSGTNTFIDLEVPQYEPNLSSSCVSCYSPSGELLKPNGEPIDQIMEYTWRLGDDLPHPNSRIARALYDVGGYYDINLRVDTSFGAYRITLYDDSIDIVEQSNLWLFNYKTHNGSSGGEIESYEFGLKSETFKLAGRSWPIERNNSFLGQPPLDYDSGDYYLSTLERARNEFENNVEFVKSGTAGSGERGNCLLFWAKGGASSDSKEILAKKHNGFDDTYQTLSSIPNRPWNWVALSSSDKTYFMLGQYSPISSGQNPAMAERVEYDLSTQSASAPVTLSVSDFENGADELLSHPSYFESGSSGSSNRATNGYFASYRSAWKGQTGYILRNSSVNEFFRFGDFYKTKGTLASPFGSITKMPDMPGSIKTEGQLLPLFNGVFFFNNSGEICAWNDTSSTWEVGRASTTSISFRSVQDSSAPDFDNRSNTLKAASDGDRMAYLSYDYSRKAMVKFNGTDLTFTILRKRPEGKQFKIGVY